MPMNDLQPITQQALEPFGTVAPYARPDGLFTQIGRRRWLFLSVFAVVSTVLLTIMLVWPKTYRATGEVLVAQEPLPAEPGTVSASAEKVGDPADIDSQVLLLRSPRWQGKILAEPRVREALRRECEVVSAQWLTIVIARIRLERDGCARDLAKLDTAPERTLEWINGRFSVQPEGQSRVISVSYTSPVPDVATIMTNLLIDTYLEGSLEAKRAPRVAGVQWLRAEIARLAGEMHNSDVDIGGYRERNGLLRGQFAPISAERLSELAKQIAVAQGANAEAQAKLQELQRKITHGQGLESSSAVLASPIVINLKAEIARLDASTARLEYGAAASAPVTQQRAKLQATLDRTIALIAESIVLEARTQGERVGNLEQQMKDLGREVARGASAETVVEGRVREMNVDRELFVSLSKRASELETERRLLSGNAQLVSHAVRPTRPWFPKYASFGAVSLVVAGSLAGLLASLRDRTDHTVRGSVGLGFAADSRVLVSIPKVRRLSVRRLSLRGGRSFPRLQEAIRALYGEIVLTGEGKLRSLLVTSSAPREGKTVVTLALGQLAAAAGRRVVIIEADLRRPGLTNFGVRSDAPGLTDLLAGSASLEEVTYPTGTAGLSFVPAGRSSMNSTELLSDERLKQAVQHATALYDLVIIDSPPARLLVDARLAARHVDGVLYCARWGWSLVDSVIAGVHEIRSAGAQVVGVVVTMTSSDEATSYTGLYRPINRPRIIPTFKE
jgi:polysaccharide biosynthesis transport protein